MQAGMQSSRLGLVKLIAYCEIDMQVDSCRLRQSTSRVWGRVNVLLAIPTVLLFGGHAWPRARAGTLPAAQILPNEIKGPAAALCTSLNWVANLIVGLTFPSMLAALHLGGTYAVYAVRPRMLFAVLCDPPRGCRASDEPWQLCAACHCLGMSEPLM